MTTRRQASKQLSEELHDDLAEEAGTPVKVWLGAAELDPIESIRHDDRCALEAFADATRALIAALIAGTCEIESDEDVRLLTTVGRPWSRYLDPALSEPPTRTRGFWRLVVWECQEHVLEIRGSRSSWSLFRFGEQIEPEEILRPTDVSTDEPDPYIPDDHDDDLMSPAEREHLLGRLDRAEEQARAAKDMARRAAVAAEERVRQVVEAAATKLERREQAFMHEKLRSRELTAETKRLSQARKEAEQIQRQKREAIKTKETELRAAIREAKLQRDVAKGELKDARSIATNLRRELKASEQRLTKSEATVNALTAREADLARRLEQSAAVAADLQEQLRNSRLLGSADQQTNSERRLQVEGLKTEVDTLRKQFNDSQRETERTADENRRIRLAIEATLTRRQQRKLDPHLRGLSR